MKNYCRTALLGAIVALTALFSTGYVNAQSVAPERPVGIINADPNSPGYDAAKEQWVAEHPDQYNQLTGNVTPVAAPEISNTPWGAPENKSSWVAEHPREYAELVQAPVDNRIRMTQVELSTFPAEKQQSILNDPNFIIID